MRIRSALLALVFVPMGVTGHTFIKPETATPIEIRVFWKSVRVLLIPDKESKIHALLKRSRPQTQIPSSHLQMLP